jgi:hypothetical protein
MMAFQLKTRINTYLSSKCYAQNRIQIFNHWLASLFWYKSHIIKILSKKKSKKSSIIYV